MLHCLPCGLFTVLGIFWSFPNISNFRVRVLTKPTVKWTLWPVNTTLRLCPGFKVKTYMKCTANEIGLGRNFWSSMTSIYFIARDAGVIGFESIDIRLRLLLRFPLPTNTMKVIWSWSTCSRFQSTIVNAVHSQHNINNVSCWWCLLSTEQRTQCCCCF